MADLIASKLTEFFIKCQVIQEADRDTYEYCFKIFLMNILNFGSILLLGLIFGCLLETILFVIGFSVIRKQAGGYHAGTPLRCYLISVASYVICMFLLYLIPSAWTKFMNLTAIIIAFIIIWRLAPVADSNKPFSIGEYERYKRNSRQIISILLMCNLIAYFIGFINIQVFMLPLNIGVLFAAVSLFSAKLLKKACSYSGR